MKNKIKIGIVGAAGYTGGELIRILLNHLNAEIIFAHSKSNAGNLLSDVHTDLLGETEMKFSSSLSDKIDVLFMDIEGSEIEAMKGANELI